MKIFKYLSLIILFVCAVNLSANAQIDTIRLKDKRLKGSSEGFYDNDIKQLNINKDGKVIKMNITPGLSHWIGYTIFKNGMVINDELMVTRPITLDSDSLSFKAEQREYILLNEMPVS